MYLSYFLISKEHFQFADDKKKFSPPPGQIIQHKEFTSLLVQIMRDDCGKDRDGWRYWNIK